MKRSSRARLCATATVGALSLALITGCGSEDSADTAESKDKGSTGSEVAAAKAATKAELEKLIVATADVAGHKVGPVTEELQAAASKSDLKVVKEACAPIAYAVSGFAPGDEAASVAGKVTQDQKKPTDTASTSMEDMSDEEFQAAFAVSMDVDITFLTLSSYDGDGAEKAMKAVSDAVADCAGGFTVTGKEPSKYTKITPVKASGAGDESVAFSATGELDDADAATGVTYSEVVRYGNTVAAYTTINLGKVVSGKPYAISAPVVKAQSAKLK